MPSKAKLIQKGLNVLEALAKDSGLLREAVERHLGAPQDEALKIAQRNAAKPVSKGGLGLPANNTPMDRARAMGFDTDVVHFSRHGIDEPELDSGKYAVAPFDAIGTHVGSKDAALERFRNTVGTTEQIKGSTYPVLIKRGNEFLMEGRPWEEDRLNSILRKMGGHDWSDINGGRMTYQQMNADLRKKLLEEFDSIPYVNDVEAKGQISYIVPPHNIRSRFAAFDPARIDENDLLAGFAALGIAAPMLTSGDSEYAKGGSIDLEAEYRMGKGGVIKSLAKAIAKELPEAKASQKTQIRGTEPTYRKAYEILEREKPGGRTLDYGAGLGHGSRLMGAESFEPFPREGFKPDFIRPEDIPTEEFDRLVNLNVLNVMPREMRDATVENIGRVMRPGGMGIVTTRGRDVLNAAGEAGPEPMSKITSIGTYQKGFTPEELREYLEYILGRDYSVSKLGLGPAGATIKKKANGGPVKMADGGGLEEEYNLRKMGMDPTRVRGGYERKPLSRAEIQAMMLDVPAGIGVPFAEAGSYALRGKTDEAKESAAIEAALIGVPGAAVLAKPAYQAVKKGVKKAAPAARDLAREFLESGMESGAILDPRLQAIAYHGTPHKFEKFDPSKIGTGEGAQAYGHGLYFAESPEIATGYRNRLAKGTIPVVDALPAEAGKNIPESAYSFIRGYEDVDAAIQGLRETTQNVPDFIKKAWSHNPKGLEKLHKDYLKSADWLEKNKDRIQIIQDRGHLYTVDIPDESVARMLDWDKPLEKQPAIRELLRGTDYEVGVTAKEAEKIADERLRQEAYDWADETGGDPVDYMNNANWEKYVDDVMQESGKVHGSTTGEELHKIIMRDQGYRKELFDPYNYQVDTSETLRGLGIPGIKYLDATSRSAGEGTRNFVVFPGEEESVKILERRKKGGSIKSGADSMNLERQFQNAIMGLKSPLKGERRYDQGGFVQPKLFNGLPFNLDALYAERQAIMREQGTSDPRYIERIWSAGPGTGEQSEVQDLRNRLIAAAGYSPSELKKLDNVDKMIGSVITQNRTPEMDQALRQIVANEQKHQEALRLASEANKLKQDKTIDPQVLQREQAKAKLGVMQSAADLNKSMGAFFGTDTFDKIEPSSQYRLDRDEMNLLGVQKDPVTQEYSLAQRNTQAAPNTRIQFDAEAFDREREALMQEYGLDFRGLHDAWQGRNDIGLTKGQTDNIRARLNQAAGEGGQRLVTGTPVLMGGRAYLDQLAGNVSRAQEQYQESLNWMKPVSERRQELIDYLEGRSPSYGGTPGMSSAELESRYLSNLRQNPERLQEFLAEANRLQDARERDPELSEKEQAGKKLFAFQRAVDLNSTLASVGSNERVEPPRLTAREMQLLGIKHNQTGTGYATLDGRWYGEDRPLDFLTRSNNIYNSIFGNTLVNPDAYRDVMQGLSPAPAPEQTLSTNQDLDVLRNNLRASFQGLHAGTVQDLVSRYDEAIAERDRVTGQKRVGTGFRLVEPQEANDILKGIRTVAYNSANPYVTSAIDDLMRGDRSNLQLYANQQSVAAPQSGGYVTTPSGAIHSGGIPSESSLITNDGPGMGLAPNLSTGMKGGTPPTSSGLITNQGPGMGLAPSLPDTGMPPLDLSAALTAITPTPVAPPAPRLNINPVVTPTIQTGTMTPTAVPQIDVQRIGRNLGAIPMRSGGAAIMKDGGRIKPDYKAALDMLFYQMRNKG